MEPYPSQTWFDRSILKEPHTCLGRCACYVNHYCLRGCAWNCVTLTAMSG